MKMFTRILSMALALMMLTVGLAMAEGEDAKTLVIGTNPYFEPFEYYEMEGTDTEIIGFDVDMMAAILAEMGYEEGSWKFESAEFDALLMGMAAGKFDMVVAGMTIRDDRKENALFSDPYFDAAQVFVVKKGDESVKTPADLAGKKVGCVLGYTGDTYLEDLEKSGTALGGVERYNNIIEALNDLNLGRLEVVVIDDAIVSFYLEQPEFSELQIAKQEGELTAEQYGIAMPLEATELQAQVNAALATIKENGTYDQLIAKWFGGEAAAEEAPAEDAEATPAE